MGELSDRFAELMARMARTDADLFRTIGEQNASVRQMVEELTLAGEPVEPPAAAAAVLAPAGLLPPEDCELKALKARFGTIATAQLWLEERLGKPPKKLSWALIEQTFRSGSWPAAPVLARKAASPSLTASAMDERLAALEQRLEQRLLQMERMLALIADAVIAQR